MLFAATLVGSHCQPGWIIDREKLEGLITPRTRAGELWRIPEPFLKVARDGATRIAVREQNKAGREIVTDGEIRRARALEPNDLNDLPRDVAFGKMKAMADGAAIVRAEVG